MRKVSGFTLIELIAVIVILGILAVTAIPKYLDMTTAANQAAVNGVAGALSGGSTLNYAARTATSSAGVAVSACINAANTLAGAQLPANFTISGGGTVSTASGIVATSCVVSGPTNLTANFTIITIS